MNDGVTLEIESLVVSFGDFRAVDDLDLLVVAGELRFVIGPNGAGKTTLIDAVTGRARVASGSIKVAGTELVHLREHRISRLGVGRTFQTPTVLEALTVRENVDLAIGRKGRLAPLVRGAPVGERAAAARVIEEVGLTAQADGPAGELSHGARKWLEIAMLLAQDARVMLLDEPVAGMTAPERAHTGELLRSIRGDRTVVVVEHDMDFLRSYADVVTVMHEGRMLAEGPVAQVQADPRVVEVYLGRSAEETPDRVGTGSE